MRFVPRTVMIGFVNALAILLFVGPAPGDSSVTAGVVYVMVAAGLAIMLRPPAADQGRPAPLVAIIVLTAVVPLRPRRRARPSATWATLPDLAADLRPAGRPVRPGDTLVIIAPYAITLAMVGLMRVPADRPADRRRSPTPARTRTRECPRPGHRQHRHRLLRRHGRLRHDRPVDDQHEESAAGPACRRCPPESSCSILILVLATDRQDDPDGGALAAVMVIVADSHLRLEVSVSLARHAPERPRSETAVMVVDGGHRRRDQQPRHRCRGRRCFPLVDVSSRAEPDGGCTVTVLRHANCRVRARVRLHLAPARRPLQLVGLNETALTAARQAQEPRAGSQ